MNETRCRQIVAERSGRMCERCGQARSDSMHHRRKRSHGGEWSPSNIVALCGSGTTGCHGWIEHNPLEANAQGWSLAWGDPHPSRVPIWHPAVSWSRVKLDDDGMFRPVP